MLKQAETIQNTLFNQVGDSFTNKISDSNLIKLCVKSYIHIKSISIDCAIMEHISNMILLEGNFDWNDLGSWNSLWEISSKDEKNNSFEGEVIAQNVNNSYVRSNGRLTAVIGLDNVVVINIGNTVLVADKAKTEEVKQIINQLDNSFKKYIH